MSQSSKIDQIGHKSFKVGFLETDLYAIAANFSTAMNLFLGLAVAIRIIIGDPLDRILVMRFIMLGASFDAIDGKLARRSNMKPRLGAQFDTLADQATFGLAPSLMILEHFSGINEFYAFILAGLYLFAAWFRLSRFMVSPTYGFFNGMPSPVAATYVAAWYTLSDPDPVLFATNMALISTVMVVNLPYTALRTITTMFQKVNFVFTVILMLLLTYAPSDWMETLAIVWILNVFYFIVIGPYNARLLLNKSEDEPTLAKI